MESTKLSLNELYPYFDDCGASISEGYFGFLDRVVTARGVLVCSKLFWPDFVHYRGGVFVDFQFQPHLVDEWMDSATSVQEVESVVNHLHMWDLFISTANDVSEMHLHQLAQVLSRSWSAAASEAFPSIEFQTEVIGEPDDYGPTLYFYSKR